MTRLRNFYIEANVDDSPKEIHFGPMKEDGGFSLGVHQRSRGTHKLVATLIGYVENGELKLRISSPGKPTTVVVTEP